MRILRWLILLVVLALLALGVALAVLPARLAVDWAGNRLGAVRLEEVGGTVWRGRAGMLRVHGKPVGALGWKLHPLALLGGRLEADLVLEGSAFRGHTFVSARGDRLRLRDARLEVGAERLQPALDIPALELRGQVELDIDEAELVAGFPRSLQGRALWRNAAVAGAAEALLGDLEAEFRSAADGALIGSVADRGGPLVLDGQFRASLSGYQADAILSARDGNPQVLEALAYIGQQQPDGSSLLEIRGQFLPLR